MNKIKIIFARKTMSNMESFIELKEKQIEKYVNDGYEIKASNMLSANGDPAIYVLLEKKE